MEEPRGEKGGPVEGPNGREPESIPRAAPEAANGAPEPGPEPNVAEDDATDGPTEVFDREPPGVALAGGNGSEAVSNDVGMTRLRLEAKDRHIRDLYDEVAALRVAVDGAEARAAAAEGRAGDLEAERERLREKVRLFEEEDRRRRRRREGVDRRVGRLEREVERREAEISRLNDLLDRRQGEMDLYGREAEDIVSRKDVALDDALRRVAGLERDLEEREAEVAALRSRVGELRAELDLEHELRRRLAEPANRLRAGIDLFNASEHARTLASISKSLGPPEARVDLREGGDEPPAILRLRWRGEAPAFRTYVSNPGLAVEEPRVYLEASGDGTDETASPERPNARVDAEGRVSLGL